VSPDQEELLHKAQESIDAALLLLNGRFPAFAVSRAYYAMFYTIQALLEGEGLAFSKHSAVISAFGKHFVKSDRVPAKFHRYLLDAWEARHEGDYAPVSKITLEAAKVHVEHVAEFLALAKNLVALKKKN
jgi:uncharacterized protein (UPF0332 family)